MPIYVFHCDDCNRDFELLMRISLFDPNKVMCEHCGSKKVSQIISHINVITSKKS